MPIGNPLDPAEIAVTLDLAGGIADHLEQLTPAFAREDGGGAAADMLRLAVASLRTSAALLRGAVTLETAPPNFTPAPEAAELAALTAGPEVKRPGSRKRVPKPKATNPEVKS